MPGDGRTGTPPAPIPPVRGRFLAFTGVVLVAVYMLGDGADAIPMAETGPGADGLHGLPGHFPLTGQPLWLEGSEFAASADTAPGTESLPAGASLAVVPLWARAGERPRGCLLVVGDPVTGLGPEQRRFLESYADEIATRSAEGGAPGREWSVPVPALERLRVGGFTLTSGTGLIDADATLLDLLETDPSDFDGKVETLLAHAVAEDVPALMAVLEPSETSAGGEEVEFRIRLPGGGLRRLRLSCRVPRGGGGRPQRVLGVVVDVSGLWPSVAEALPLQRLSAELASAQTVRDVSRLAVAALRELLGADRAVLGELEADRLVVAVLDPPQATAWPKSWRSEWRAEWPDPPIHTMPSLSAVLRDGVLRIWPAGAAVEPGLAAIGPGGLAVLPLPAQGRIVGACLVGWDQPRELGPEEQSLLTVTARLVGQALVRAIAYDADQELATMLQRALLPQRLPTLPGGEAVARYLPATHGLQVGGDWYDVISLAENHVALVIGDVQGHSTAAVTIMGQMLTAIRAYAVEGHPPDVVLSHANRLLVGMETELFATCCYVELNMEDGDALFARAGHLPPLLRFSDGGTREVAVDGGPPLGVLADAEFPMTAVALPPGTVLALLTDGLVESSRLPLDEGLRQVRHILAAAETSDIGRLADDLIAERAQAADDDVALLLLRYDGMKVRPTRASSVVWRLPDAVMHARRFTMRTLRSWHLADVGDLADVALLVVSELVTNAVVHTHGMVRLDLTLSSDHLRIAVSDSSPRAPAKPVVVDWTATGGRGLLLVEAMSGGWGAVPVSGGKQVWSEIVVPPRESPADAETAAPT